MKALVSENAVQTSERAFLIGAQFKSRTAWEVQDSLSELGQLATTAGADIVGYGTQKLEKPAARTFIGPGKAGEFAAKCHEEAVDTIIFDDELSPAQSRNLEQVFELKILDRTQLILDIFGQRARTREGKLQVELAQLQHLLPRLTRFWTHLSRQKGGIGMRGGEGETQLEADRRKVQERIDKLIRELESVRRQRATQREGRKRHQWPLASIVGYTNAGKSTLLNALTGANALAEDKLFATLDPTTRRLRLETNQNVLLSDTVGFIRKLPHRLVEAFKATLEEVVEADLLLHVVDVSHPKADEQIAAVNSVLAEIHAGEKPTLMVFNKIDCLGVDASLERFREQYPHAAFVSARTGRGLTELMAELGMQLRPVREAMELSIPHGEAAAIARLHAVGQILESDYDQEDAARFKALVPPHLGHEFRRFERSHPTISKAKARVS
ncbi:MAG: GTPase HflX [Verrucomicrobiales bacterium]|nr:GTPase HflX [Verrucomicrobiales bacterium]